MYKVSVIVPVYNVEKYIERCARSLFQQTLDDIEYIFIDDCSTDKSIQVLERVVDEYPSRKASTIIHTMGENSGQAKVRRWGIEHARGQFVIHCDPDDCVTNDAYEKLYDYAVRNNCDIVFHDFFLVNSKGVAYVKLLSAKIKKEILLSNLINGKTKGSLCLSLIKGDLYKNNSFVFPIGDMTEDVTMIIQLLCISETFGYLKEALYYYFVREDSIAHGMTLEHCLKRFRDCKSNTALIIDYMGNENGNFFLEDIYARKLSTINQLLPIIYKPRYFYVWHKTYSKMIRGVLHNTKVDRQSKIKYLVTYLGAYPIYHFVKRYQFGR